MNPNPKADVGSNPNCRCAQGVADVTILPDAQCALHRFCGLFPTQPRSVGVEMKGSVSVFLER
jgi:hypothetical protein